MEGHERLGMAGMRRGDAGEGHAKREGERQSKGRNRRARHAQNDVAASKDGADRAPIANAIVLGLERLGAACREDGGCDDSSEKGRQETTRKRRLTIE